MIERRTFLAGSGAVLLAAPLAAGAQTIPKVGYLSIGSASDPRRATLLGAFQQGLREFGYIERQNAVVEARYADGRALAGTMYPW